MKRSPYLFLSLRDFSFDRDQGRSPLRLYKAWAQGKLDEAAQNIETQFTLETWQPNPKKVRPTKPLQEPTPSGQLPAIIRHPSAIGPSVSVTFRKPRLLDIQPAYLVYSHDQIKHGARHCRI